MTRLISRILRRLGIVVFRPRETASDRRKAMTAALAENAPQGLVERLRRVGAL